MRSLAGVALVVLAAFGIVFLTWIMVAASQRESDNHTEYWRDAQIVKVCHGFLLRQVRIWRLKDGTLVDDNRRPYVKVPFVC